MEPNIIIHPQACAPFLKVECALRISIDVVGQNETRGKGLHDVEDPPLRVYNQSMGKYGDDRYTTYFINGKFEEKYYPLENLKNWALEKT